MRRTMTKEVTKTTVRVSKVEQGENGIPTAIELPAVTLLGNVNLEKAQKEVQKQYEEPVTVFEVQADTKVYEMPVEKFIELAEIKQDEPEEIEAPAAVSE